METQSHWSGDEACPEDLAVTSFKIAIRLFTYHHDANCY